MNFVHSRIFLCIEHILYFKTLFGDISVRYVTLRPNRNLK